MTDTARGAIGCGKATSPTKRVRVPPRAALLSGYRNAWAALAMVREALETLGPVGLLPSSEAVLALYGPEPVHEAEALVGAITELAMSCGGYVCPTCKNSDPYGYLLCAHPMCPDGRDAAHRAECARRSPFEKVFRFHRLHVPTGERSTAEHRGSREGFLAELARWNAQQPGVWQYWEVASCEARLAETLTRGQLIEVVELAIGLEGDESSVPSHTLQRLLEALR